MCSSAPISKIQKYFVINFKNVYKLSAMLLFFKASTLLVLIQLTISLRKSSIIINNDFKNFPRINSAVSIDILKKKLHSKLLPSLLGCIVGFCTLHGESSLTTSAYASSQSQYPLFEEVWTITNENFVDETHNNHDWNQLKNSYMQRLKNGADERELTKRMLELLGDKYTRLLDKKVFESLWKYDAVGVGLLFQSEPGSMMYISAPPIGGSEGEKAGIKKGDIIYSINGEATDKMTALDFLDKMSNDNRNFVTLEFGPASSDASNKKKVTLTRTTQKAINPVEFNIQQLRNGKRAGYIKLKEFNAEAVPGIKQALSDLNVKGVDEIVLDLRGNTGGGFQFALNIGGMFLENKEMVKAIGKGSEKNTFWSSYPEGVLYRKPLLIWTDGLSASASEVLVSGLRDNCRAITIGEKTFGKGKIQAVFGLANGDGLTLTVAQYITPKGSIIQSKGIQPDIQIKGTNPYVAAIVSPLIPAIQSTPDLNSIDFDKANSILNSCSNE